MTPRSPLGGSAPSARRRPGDEWAREQKPFRDPRHPRFEWIVRETDLSQYQDATERAYEEARRLYPNLFKKGTPLNLALHAKVELYDKIKPEFFLQADWVLEIASELVLDFMGYYPTAFKVLPCCEGQDGKSHGRN